MRGITERSSRNCTLRQVILLCDPDLHAYERRITISEQNNIGQEIIQTVSRRQGCFIEDITVACAMATWNQVFLAVDDFSRTGRIKLMLEGRGLYRLWAPDLGPTIRKPKSRTAVEVKPVGLRINSRTKEEGALCRRQSAANAIMRKLFAEDEQLNALTDYMLS